MVSLTTENVLAAMKTAEAEAAAAYAVAAQMRDKMAAEGVNPLADTDAFAKLDEAFKAHGVKAQEVEELRGRLAKLQGWDALEGGSRAGIPTPLAAPGAAPAGPSTIFRIGARLTETDAYKAIAAQAASMGDSQFVAAVKAGLNFESAVPVLPRADLQALLIAGKYGAATITGGSATSAGPFIQNDLVPGFIAYRRKRATLAAVVGQGETDSDTVEYVTQSAPTSTAAETGETNSATESTYAYATNTVAVQEITHYVPITRRAMADAGQMRTIVENDLVIDVLDRLDTQLATGSGTNDDLQGIYTAVSQAQALGGDERADALHKAMTKIRVAAGVYGEPDYVGIHPNDYEQLILSTDGQGRYQFGPPSQEGSRTVWGVPFLLSTVFTEGMPLVGNYELGARLWVREGVSVQAGLNDDDFVRRRISLLASMRVAFKTVRPTAFCEVTGF